MKKLTHDLSLEIGTWKVRIRGTTLIEDHEPKKKDDKPSSPVSLWVAALFGRTKDDLWNDKEKAAYMKARAVFEKEEDRALIQAYYEAERKKGTGKDGGCHRRDLLTFLNHAEGERDRAREYKPMNGHQQASGRWGV